MDKIWSNTSIDLGTIKEKSKNKIIFRQVNKKEIASIQPSCGCTNGFVNNSEGTVEVTYNAGELPIHIRRAGQHVITTKSILVKYLDGSSEKLSFTAKITA